MPGHKSSRDFLPDFLLDRDITEIPGADDLNDPDPDGIIGGFQKYLAGLFGADMSFFLTNGSTSGVQAAIIAAVGDGKIIMDRASHASAYAALVLSGAEPVYIYPEITPFGFRGGVTPSAAEETLRCNPGARAVFVTSPAYEGVVSDIDNIAAAAHNNGIPLIVDEAHGPHFIFDKYFPKTALSCGADMVVHSLHKTLPAFTQSAVLHLRGNLVDKRAAAEAVRLLRTSSPSYMMMAQAEYALKLLDSDKKYINEHAAALKIFRENALYLKNIKLFVGFDNKKFGVYDIDRSKLVFTIKNSAITGTELASLLYKNYGISIEMAGPNHIVAMTSPGDKAGWYDRLLTALRDLDEQSGDGTNMPELSPPPPVISVVRPRAAFLAEKEDVPLRLAAERISGGFVAASPPNVPVIVPGELFTADVISHIENQMCLGAHLTGLVGGFVRVLKKI